MAANSNDEPRARLSLVLDEQPERHFTNLERSLERLRAEGSEQVLIAELQQVLDELREAMRGLTY